MLIRGRIRGDVGRARRLDGSPWRDPRLIVGVILVLASAVLGGWLVESADDTSSYWATRTDVRAGDPVRSADLVAIRAKVPVRTAESPAAEARARRILSGVTVVSRTSASGIAGGPGLTLVVDVAGTNLDDDLMGALSTARLTVVRVP